jgi:RNA polymerase sigma-70 factor (ECF subfamily)
MVGEADLNSMDRAIDLGLRQRFVALVDAYAPSLHRLALAYTRDQADADDLFQEIAFALWQALPRFRGEASERTWLYRIAHNVAITASGKLKRRKSVERSDTGSVEPSTDRHPEQELLAAEKRELLLEAIRALPAGDRQIILLHLEGLSYAEIEEISGMTQGALATRVSRIRDKLGSQLGGHKK